VAAEVGELARVELGHVDVVDEDATAVRTVEASDGVEEGRLTRSGRSHDRDVLATADVDADAVQGAQHFVAEFEDLDEFFGADDVFGS